jgi:hypothetical protein
MAPHKLATMSWPVPPEFLAQNWGNLASVAGLAASVATFVVATKARQAAEAAPEKPASLQLHRE